MFLHVNRYFCVRDRREKHRWVAAILNMKVTSHFIDFVRPQIPVSFNLVFLIRITSSFFLSTSPKLVLSFITVSKKKNNCVEK